MGFNPRTSPLALLLVSCLANVASDGALAAADTERSLHVLTRDDLLPSLPVVVRLELHDATGQPDRQSWDAEVTLEVSEGTIQPERVRLHNGIGTALVVVDEFGDDSVTLRAGTEGLVVSKTFRRLTTTAGARVTGALSAGLTEWRGLVTVTDRLSVPRGATLRVHPGCLVLFEGGDAPYGAVVDVAGRLEILGTPSRPVTLTAGRGQPAWGGIRFADDSSGVVRFANVTRGGRTPIRGIAESGPVILATRAELSVAFSNFTDHVGKVLYAEHGHLRVEGCVVSRAVLGFQTIETQVTIAGSLFSEMHGADDEDDNDFLHISGDNVSTTLRVTDCVFADGTDDALDLGELLRADIERSIVRDLGDKGISLFHGELRVVQSVFADNAIGVSTKAGDSVPVRVHIDRTTLVDNRLTLEARDKFDVPDARIFYEVTNSILRHASGEDASLVRTDYDPESITLRHSNLSVDWPHAGSSDNGHDDPVFLDRDRHDFRLGRYVSLH